MKKLYALSLVTVCAIALGSCKKEKGTTAAIPLVYNGKYLETKLRIYQVAGPNVTSDTTYSESAFNENDYVTFINGVCTQSADYAYNPLVSSPRLTKNASAAIETYNFGYQNGFYILNNPQPALTPGGFYTDTLKAYDRSTWIVHSVYINPTPGPSLYMPQTVVDAYYTQQ